jgi:hypothetical protein
MTANSRAVAPARLARRTMMGLTAALAATLAACSLMTPAGASVPPTAQGTSIPGSLAAVSCPATNACWAVGWRAPVTPSTAIVAQWNGSAWSQDSIPFPSGAQSTSLTSVSCPSVTLCWAVGFYTASSRPHSYALQWNGTAWSQVTLSLPAGVISFAVSCSSTVDCWEAQGFGGTPPLEHWNGTAWTMAALPAQVRLFQPALSCVSASDCWLVAPYKTHGGTYAAHWDGSSWSLVRLPSSILPSGISCLGKACAAVSTDGNAGAGKGVFAERWNGSAWKVTLTGGRGTRSAGLNAVSCAAGGSCLAVGGKARGANPGAFSELWTGAHWHRLTTPGGYELLGVSCVTATDCWAVGGLPPSTGSTTSIIEHWNGTAWSIVS